MTVVLLLLAACAVAFTVWALIAGTLARPVSALSLKVIARTDHTPELFTLKLARAGLGWPLPRFAPGQSVAIQSRDGRVRRQYSLARWSRWPLTYEVTIRREEHGRLSSELWRDAKVGTRWQVAHPRGEFTLSTIPQRTVLLAGGVGITPLLAMSDYWRAHRQSGQTLDLFWQVRHEAEWCYRRELEAHPAIRLHCLASRPQHGEGVRIDADLIAQTLGRLDDCEFYLCASNGLLDSLITQLRAAGVAEEWIHFERFGVAAVGDAGEWDIDFAGEKLRFAGHHTLLDALEAGGVDLGADCRAGSCGRCAVKVKAGELVQLVEPECAVAEGQALACCCVPKSDLQLTPV